MKYVKMLGLAVVAAAALMAFAGAGTASATVLCKNSESASSCNENYPSETELKSSLSAGTKAILKTEIKTIECSKSTLSGKPENGGSATETVKGPIAALAFEECNCEVKSLKKGTVEIHWISGSTNGTVTATGAEVTVNCSTIFGLVHCIYVTEKTDLGTLTGGNPAKIDVKAVLPRLATSAPCSATATWEATYEFTSPKPLFVTEAAGLVITPDPLKFPEINLGKLVKITNPGTVTINNIGLGIEEEEDFEMAEVCQGVTLKKGESCEESIQCLTAGAEGKFEALSLNPFVIATTTLKC
jgi:hypothetical protein